MFNREAPVCIGQHRGDGVIVLLSKGSDRRTRDGLSGGGIHNTPGDAESGICGAKGRLRPSVQGPYKSEGDSDPERDAPHERPCWQSDLQWAGPSTTISFVDEGSSVMTWPGFGSAASASGLRYSS